MKREIMMISLISLLFLLPVYAGASDLGGIRFSLIRGDVQVRTEDTVDWVPASINMPLREGDRIWVPEEGMAELQAKDGSHLRLAERSALEILSLQSDSYQAYLTGGRLYANFRGRKDSLLQIDTPTSSVRAHERSKFNVDVPERGPVNVSVLHGETYVENRDGNIRVASGEVLSLREGADSEKSSLGAPDDWERWNWERDRTVAERQPPSRHLPEELQPYSNDFHENGRWAYTSDYGYVWTPTVSVSVGWAPYRSGRWVWIGGDYVWVSYEPWGWVPYHYGRWAFVVSIGWCWVPPSRGAVYWGPGYVGWVYTSRHVAWVPLAPREVYYGRGHHGPHSVNITHVNVTNVHVDKVVYKNVRVHDAVTTVNHDTFVGGKPADARVRENPFLKERIHVGRPPVKPEKSSMMPVLREVPQTKRPPEPIQHVNVKELKAERPMVKAKETSVFAPEARPREMPVKANETRPLVTESERAKQLRQPSKRGGESRPSAVTEQRAGQPTTARSTLKTSKESMKSEDASGSTKQEKKAPAEVQGQRQPVSADKGNNRAAPSEPAAKDHKERRPSEGGMEKTAQPGPKSLEAREKGQGKPANGGASQQVLAVPAVDKSRQSSPTPAEVQERKQPVLNDRNASQKPPSAVSTPRETRTPETGMDRTKESRGQERVVEPARSPVSSPARAMQQAPEPRTPEKRMQRPKQAKNGEKGAERP